MPYNSLIPIRYLSRRFIGKLLLILGGTWLAWQYALAPLFLGALSTEPVALEQGYALLSQARMTPPGAPQEQLFQAAADAFRHSIHQPGAQVQSFIGMAQSYLGMQTPLRRFPYLWSTAPLQQAEQSLQQALRLEPGNVPAALLLSIVFWRHAVAYPAQREGYLAQSVTLLNRVASLGLPVRLVAMEVALTSDAIPAFGVQDALVALQAIDARGTGRQEDWLLAYCMQRREQGCFSMVLSAGTAYPLIADPATGAVVPVNAALEGLTVEPSPRGQPVIVVHGRHEDHPFAAQFGWEGNHFALLAADSRTR